MDSVVAKYMSRAVPRYTSYPTAPYFSKGIEAETYATWLGSLDAADPISLYVHVPFCKQVCWYCGCNMKLAAKYEPVADYVEVLLKEIELVRATLPTTLPVAHIHFGGGTPTTLSPDDMARVIGAIRAAFDILPDAEIAIECDPRTLTPEMALRLGELGFNRASFGVQEFDPKVQAAINRIQPQEMVAKAVGGLRGAGIQAINFDLIYGLPYQTVGSITNTVEDCIAMTPDRIALFGYAHVPWMAKKQQMIPDSSLPGASERLDQATAAAEALCRAGYRQIGLDHFALEGDSLAVAAAMGTLHRNFQGYTADPAGTLIGLGATSIGRMPQGFIQNTTETGAWARSVVDGILPVAKGLAFQDDDLVRSDVIERLMCDGFVDAIGLARSHGYPADHFTLAFDELAPMAIEGLVELDGGMVRMTEKGMVLVRVVASAFDTYLHARAARHSVAV